MDAYDSRMDRTGDQLTESRTVTTGIELTGLMTDTTTEIEQDIDYNIIGNIEECNLINRTFFCKKNRDAIQRAIRRGVYELSGDSKWIISKQSSQELMTIMRETYQTSDRSVDLAGDAVTEHIRKLNYSVVKQAVHKILINLIAYTNYMADTNAPRLPYQNPIFTDQRGTKLEVIKPENQFVTRRE